MYANFINVIAMIITSRQKFTFHQKIIHKYSSSLFISFIMTH